MISKRLNTKITAMMASVITFFGLVTVFLVHMFLSQKINLNRVELIQSEINHQSSNLNRLFMTSINLANIVATDKSFVAYVKDQKKTLEVGEINEKLVNYNLGNNNLAIYLIGKNGITLASTDQSFFDQDYSFRQYFKKAITGTEYADVNLGVTSKKLGYYFASPIKSGEEIVGVAVVKMNPEVVFNLFDEADNASMSDLMLVDNFGIVVASKQEGVIYKSLGKISEDNMGKLLTENKYYGIEINALPYQSIIDDLPEVNESKKYNVMNTDSDKSEDLIVKKIGNFNFYLVGKINNTSVVGEVNNMGLKTGLTVFMTVFLAMVFISTIINKQLKPLGDLLILSRKILAGDLDSKNSVKSNDELAELGQTLETMSETLKHRYDELEKIVEERTAKLTEQAESMESTKLAVNNILSDVENVAVDLEKFKMAVENASDHIVITDAEGLIIYANKAVESITGFSRYSCIGKKAGNKELWGGQMTLDFYKKLWKTIKIDKKVFDGEVNNIKKSGQKYVAKISVSPVLNNKGEVMYFVGIERDITREKDVDQGKTDFIYLTSHQLRTPLSAMKWFCEMLLAGDAGKLNKDQTEFVTNISLSNMRMIDLVNSLLNISRIESGRIIVDSIPTDLGVLIQDVLTELDNKIKEKKQKVVVNIFEDLPKINIDPKLIREVYKNLLSNANKYTQEGGEIIVGVTKQDEEIISQISDNGFGIPVQGQSKIFERFYRAENILKLETEGTGLGLYLAKAIVESSKGKIWFKSEEGKGTSFWFTLPTSGVKAHDGQVTINS